MKKKDISFAEEAQRIENKYYRIRKPGDDKMTDEAFNHEMQKLMQKQESVKQNLQFANQESSQESGEYEDYSPQNPQRLMYGIGGNLRKYNNGGGFKFNPNEFVEDELSRNLDYADILSQSPSSTYDVPNFDYSSLNSPQSFIPNKDEQTAMNTASEFQNKGIVFGKQREINEFEGSDRNASVKQNKQYSPKANILGPAATIGTSLIASLIRNKGLKDSGKNLMKYTNLGRVNAQQIDLGRERANLRSNAALSDAAGRYYSQGATSASEAANIQNQARLGSQRILGEGLSRSYQTEESENARLRSIADMANQQIASDEAQMKLGVQSQFGKGRQAETWVDFAKSTGQSMADYLHENQRIKDFYSELNMMNPNYELDFQDKYSKLSPWMQGLARLRIYNPGYTKKVKDGKTT